MKVGDGEVTWSSVGGQVGVHRSMEQSDLVEWTLDNGRLLSESNSELGFFFKRLSLSLCLFF